MDHPVVVRVVAVAGVVAAGLNGALGQAGQVQKPAARPYAGVAPPVEWAAGRSWSMTAWLAWSCWRATSTDWNTHLDNT